VICGLAGICAILLHLDHFSKVSRPSQSIQHLQLKLFTSRTRSQNREVQVKVPRIRNLDLRIEQHYWHTFCCLIVFCATQTVADAQQVRQSNQSGQATVRLSGPNSNPTTTETPTDFNAQSSPKFRIPYVSTNQLPPQPQQRNPQFERPPITSRPLPPIRGSEPLRDGFLPPTPDETAQDRANRFVLERVDPQLTIDLEVGRPVILRLKKAPFRDQVANPEIVDVLNITDTELSITGKKAGTTVVNFWFEDPNVASGQSVLSYIVRVTSAIDPEADNIKVKLVKLEDEINRAFPNSFVRLQYVGNQVIVRGQAKDVEEASAMLRIVSSNIGQSERAIKALQEGQVTSDDLDQLPNDSVLLLDRNVTSQLQEGQSLPGLLQGNTVSGANAFRINNRVVNMLEIGGIHQVMLKVTVAEVNRSASRAIGADLTLGSLGNNSSFFSLLPLADLSMGGLGGTFLVNRGDFELAINALKQLNLARSLAEPNLVTLNGQPATFDVGGRFPVPGNAILTNTGGAIQVGVEFVPFGVELNFTPTVTDGDRIRLQLNAQVSTRDEAATANVGGTNVPGLNRREFENTVELREGQTIAIAGLIQSNLGATSSRVPFFGDVPYLGRLFSSDGTSYDEQELIVLVTPYLVNPIDAKEKPLPLPGSDYYEPDDLEFFLRGSLEGHIAEDFRSAARTDLQKIKAFRRQEQDFIIGKPGHSNGLLCPSVDTKVHP